jgi:hypothetical protein
MKKETIHIGSKFIEIDIFTVSGKQGKYHLAFSPTLNVSGYGLTKQEAKESYEYNLKVFCEDVFSLNLKKRHQYIQSLGFKQDHIKKRNFIRPKPALDKEIKHLENPIIHQRNLQVYA